MPIVLATENAHKAAEIKAILLPWLPHNITLIEQSIALPDGLQTEENGQTFIDNARLKAKAVADATGLPAIADDSGLCVDALGGAPGIYSRRWAGPEATDQERIRLLLSELERCAAKTPEERKADFVCAAVLVLPDGSEIVAAGQCPGFISAAPRGTGGFGYDPVFSIPELGCTMADLTEEQKNRISHRAQALNRLGRQIAAGAGRLLQYSNG